MFVILCSLLFFPPCHNLLLWVVLYVLFEVVVVLCVSFCAKRCWWKVNKVVFCMYVLCKVIVVMFVFYELLLYKMSEGVVSSLEVVELGVQLGVWQKVFGSGVYLDVLWQFVSNYFVCCDNCSIPPPPKMMLIKSEESWFFVCKKLATMTRCMFHEWTKEQHRKTLLGLVFELGGWNLIGILDVFLFVFCRVATCFVSCIRW